MMQACPSKRAACRKTDWRRPADSGPRRRDGRKPQLQDAPAEAGALLSAASSAMLVKDVKGRSVPRPTDLQLSMVHDPSGSEFEALYSIYRRALPTRERKSREALIAMMARPGYTFLIARRADRVLGFAIVFISPSTDMVLLEYMAVDEDLRGSGIGTALFEHARSQATHEGGVAPVLVEVESDREEGSDRNLRARRKAFYRQLGCREIEDLDYIMPLPGTGPPPLMDLIVCGLKGDSIPTARLTKWIEAIYTEVYGCPPDDPRIQRMLTGMGSVLRVS